MNDRYDSKRPNIRSSISTLTPATEFDVDAMIELMDVDFTIEPVFAGLTEKFVLKHTYSYKPESKYCLFVGDTAFTDTPISIYNPTITAAGAFEGNGITFCLYDSNGTKIRTSNLVLSTFYGKKIGKLS